MLGVLACWASGRHGIVGFGVCTASVRPAHRVTDEMPTCAGKTLALVEMRMVIALLMQRYDIRFVEGFDPQTWEDTKIGW